MVFLLSSLAACQAPRAPTPPPWSATLEQRFAHIDEELDGSLGVYVKDLDSGGVAAYAGDRPFYLASTVKLLVLVAVYEAIAAGRLHLGDERMVTEADLRDGSKLFQKAAPGSRVTIDRLLSLMVEHSDNGAADMLIAAVGIEAVNRVLSSRSLPSGPITSLLDVRREVYAQLDVRARQFTPQQVFEVWQQHSFTRRARKLGRLLRSDEAAFDRRSLERAYDAYYATGMNTAPMRSMGTLLEGIARGEVVSREASQEMLERLLRCATGKGRLRAGLPPDARLAHKTGTQHRRACNVGIAYLHEQRPVVIAVCAERFKDPGNADRAISAVAKATYEALRPADVAATSM